MLENNYLAILAWRIKCKCWLMPCVFFFLDLLCVEFHPLLFLPHNHYCEYSILISGDGMLLMGAGAVFK